MADKVAKAVVDANGESCPVSVNSLDGESCQPSPFVFGSACLPDPIEKGSCVPVSLEKEDDSSSEDVPWAWTKKVGASCHTRLDVTSSKGSGCTARI